MRAVTVVDGHLEIREHPDPVPGTGELLVRVRAAGLNRGDLMQMAGFYPAPPGSPPDIPGMELAGEVVGTGPGVSRFSDGDQVMAVVGGGGQAELALVHERIAMPVPPGLGWPEAGGFPEVFLTAHDALFTQAGLQMGERVLIHGAAGGVGTAAVQLARATGALVTASVRNKDLRHAVRSIGAEAVVPHDEFVAHGPYEVVLELVGAVNLAGNLEALSTGGRIVIIGIGAGARAELDLLAVMGKRARISGSTLRHRPLEEKALVARRAEAHVVPLLSEGRVRVLVEAVYPLDEAAVAYARFEQGAKLGKIVLVMN